MEAFQSDLERLDLLLHRQILRLRARYQLSLDEFRGLYIGDDQVDALLARVAAKDEGITAPADLGARAEHLREACARHRAEHERWQQLVDAFELDRLDEEVLLLALAPQLDLKYETLFAYLNDDVGRRWPTIDLTLGVLGATTDERQQLLAHLLPESPLFRHGLLQPVDATPTAPSWRALGFQLATGVTHHLLGANALETDQDAGVRLSHPAVGWDHLPVNPAQRAALQRLATLFTTPRDGPIVLLDGQSSAERLLCTEALCSDLGKPLLLVDVRAAQAAGHGWTRYLRDLRQRQRLAGAGVFLRGADALIDDGGKPTGDALLLLQALPALSTPVTLELHPASRWHDLLRGRRVLSVSLGEPEPALRRELWRSTLASHGFEWDDPLVSDLADRFTLAPGQIGDAVQRAADRRRLQGEVATEPMRQLLFAAAREQSDRQLARLAVKVATHYRWDDLVLPPATRRRIEEVAAAIGSRRRVYHDWGFGRQLAISGYSALFSGPPGTGKTMAAAVIAHELGFDLYKIDLSSVVSKYIGETEKNLDRIFAAAESSSAIVFFDEADALFGKRSEVKDAHDRYANIEVAYLLQKLEGHGGVVLLASNLSRNLDTAFSRRLQAVLEFAPPTAPYREALWRGMFAPQAPLADDVDFAFLAGQFELAGGDIRNAALDAAFIAAQNGRLIGMRHLVRAVARQQLKQGKAPTATDFGRYHPLLEDREL